MNKDVIYIEPEYDITDIVSKIKNAKNKIVALVPPKKATVLHSAVNFKLIQKTAHQNEKTIVLITNDAALIKFAAGVKMPVAKTLQSKPRLPELDAEELGEEDAEKDLLIEEEKRNPDVSADFDAPTKAKSEAKGAAKDVDMELKEPKTSKATGKMACKKVKKVPEFKKYQKQIIVGAVAVVALFFGVFWALVIAPAVNLTVSVKANEKNFSRQLELTRDQKKQSIEGAVLYAEEKIVKKTASADFTATGIVDKGEKARGKIVIRRKSPVIMAWGGQFKPITIKAGTSVSHGEYNFVTVNDVTLAAPEMGKQVKKDDCDFDDNDFSVICQLSQDITATVDIVADKSGEAYNSEATNSGWTINAGGVEFYSSEGTSGGTTKEVRIVTADDIAHAQENLEQQNRDEIYKQLESEFEKDYIVIRNSFKADDGKISASPAEGGEVNDETTPKIVQETNYRVFIVDRKNVDELIRNELRNELGDDTQDIYSTGVYPEGEELGKDKKKDNKPRAFFESFKDENGKLSVKLKSVTKTGPRVTPEMVADKALGKKIGEVRTMLASINGVSDVKVEKSVPWVTTIPKDINKVNIKVVVE